MNNNQSLSQHDDLDNTTIDHSLEQASIQSDIQSINHNQSNVLSPSELPPVPTPGSSSLVVLQHSYDTYTSLIQSLCTNEPHKPLVKQSIDQTSKSFNHGSGGVTLDQLHTVLSLFEPLGLPALSTDETKQIMDLVIQSTNHPSSQATTQPITQLIKSSDQPLIQSANQTRQSTSQPMLTFSQFHSIYSSCIILAALSKTDLPHLRMKDVRRALLHAGFNPTQHQLESMFVLGDQYRTHDRSGPIDLLSFVRIYLEGSFDHTELFLHSWFHAGRNSTPYNRPVEISPSEDFLAGTAAGVALTLVGHPLDTLKVRMQTQAEFTSVINCFMSAVRNEGPLSLFKGMSSPLFTIPFVNAIVFSAYATAKRGLHALQATPAPLSLGEITIAGAFAGLMSCVITTPVELVKTRLQLQFDAKTVPSSIKFTGRPFLNDASTKAAAAALNIARPLPQFTPHALLGPLSTLPHSSEFTGALDCVKKIVEANGLKGLWRGMSATIYREVPGYAGQFFMYEKLKRAFTLPGEKVTDLSAARLIMAGGLAGIAGWMCSYPQDFIKSQIQSEPYNLKTPWKKHPILLDGGFFDCLQNTVKNHGYKALWRGFPTCLLRAWPANAAGFIAYETTLKWLKNTDDGAKENNNEALK